jgi:hypothetical protein
VTTLTVLGPRPPPPIAMMRMPTRRPLNAFAVPASGFAVTLRAKESTEWRQAVTAGRSVLSGKNEEPPLSARLKHGSTTAGVTSRMIKGSRALPRHRSARRRAEQPTG